MSGASTITQQLIKQVYGRPSGLWSKGMEILRACALERLFDKDEILEQYVNRLPFGDRIQGVGTASQEYFGHPVSELSVSEAALLAGIPQAPTLTEPRRHLSRALARRAVVLGRMQATGAIDESTRRAILAETPSIRAAPARPNEAPRFIEHVLREWQHGNLEREGPRIRTSLDLELQHRVEAILTTSVSRFASRGGTNAAGIVLAGATGEVLAYVGAAVHDAQAPGGALDLLERPRQPGSTLKPFVYELLFERGGTAATLLDDIALPLRGAHGATFEAHDYDGQERGPVLARAALAASLNLAALDAATRVGPDAIVARLRALGFRGIGSPDRYGAAAVLGGIDVAPLDLARAYLALARGGRSPGVWWGPARPERATSQVMRPEACAVVSDILMDARARTLGFGRDLADVAGMSRFALRTGTSSGWRDAWAAAFSRNAIVLVWLGDPGGRPLAAVSGFEAAAPAAARILGLAESRREAAGANASQQPSTPAVTLVPLDICPWSGLRPGPRCQHVTREIFAAGTEPTRTCQVHDAEGRAMLPAKYADWVARTHPAGVAEAPLLPKTAGELVVREPADGAELLLDRTRGDTELRLRATLGGVSVADVAWEADGQRLAEARWAATAGTHLLVAVRGRLRSPPARVTVTLE